MPDKRAEEDFLFGFLIYSLFKRIRSITAIHLILPSVKVHDHPVKTFNADIGNCFVCIIISYLTVCVINILIDIEICVIIAFFDFKIPAAQSIPIAIKIFIQIAVRNDLRDLNGIKITVDNKFLHINHR